MRKSKYKSKIFKQRDARICREIERALDEAIEEMALSKSQMDAEVKQLLKTSPDYADLNNFCLEFMSLYGECSFKAVDFDATNKRLVYSFDSDAEWERVKEFYTAWVSKQGWRIIDESEKFPTLDDRVDKISVKTDNYKITLCDFSIGDFFLLVGEKD